jgi:hypothetical protein
MPRLRLLVAGILSLTFTIWPAHAQQISPPVLFVNVNVVPMDREHVLRGQSVLVEEGRIRAIGRQLTAPAGAAVIDGRGTAYLLPGLADMHVHVGSREELAVMLANGITSALDMGEAPSAFVGRTRAAVEQGTVPGPRVCAALAVDGSPRFGHLVLPTPAAARAAVLLAEANGYEFLKVYTGLAPDVLAALATAGNAAGLPIIGHNVERMGIERQLVSGQVMVAHLEEFIYGFFTVPEGGDPLAAPDPSEIARAVAFLQRGGATVTADLAAFERISRQWGRPEVVEAYLRQPEVRYLSPARRIEWRASGYVRRSASLEARAAFLARFVKALADAGIPLISGTDAPTIPGLVNGFALHLNLAALEQAGLSRYQALATATREPGAFMARTHPLLDRFGTVVAGARADLLLVSNNPLEDLGTLKQPLGVMTNGRWHSAADLQALLEEVAAKYEGAALPDQLTTGTP